MFQITYGAGFKMTFANGYTVSVQFRPGNYCENRNHEDEIQMYQNGVVKPNVPGAPIYECPDAEVAVLAPDNTYVRHPSWDHCDDVKGWVKPDEVAGLIAWVANIGAPADNSPALGR